MPNPDTSGHPQVLRSDTAGGWQLEAHDAGNSVHWQRPPQVLGKLLNELFSAQPEDVLTWIHSAVWRMCKEELIHSQQPDLSKTRSASSVDPSRSLRIRDDMTENMYFTDMSEQGVNESRNLDDICVDPTYLASCSPRSEYSMALATESSPAAISPSSKQNASLRKLFMRSASQASQANAPFGSLGSRGSFGDDEDQIEDSENLMLSLRHWPAHSSPARPFGSTQRIFANRPSGQDSARSALHSVPEDVVHGGMSHVLSSTQLAGVGSTGVGSAALSEMSRNLSMATADTNWTAAEALNWTDLASRDFKDSTSNIQLSKSQSSLRSTLASAKLPNHQGSTASEKSPPGKRGLSSSRFSHMTEQGKGRFSFLWNLPIRASHSQPNQDMDFGHHKSDLSNSTPNWMDHFIAPTGSQQIEMEAMRTGTAFADSFSLLSPLRTWRVIWELLNIACIFLHLWAMTFALLFVRVEDGLPHWLEKILTAVFVFFCIDMFLRFVTGSMFHGKVVTDGKIIWRMYLKGWFWVDFLSMVPYIAVLHGSRRVTQDIGWLSLFRVLRVLNIPNWCRLFWLHANIYPDRARYLVYLFEIHLFLLLLAHFNCLCWAALHPLERETWRALELYLQSLRWSFTVLTCGVDLPTDSKESQGGQALSILVSLERVTILAMLLVMVAWEQVKLICAEEFTMHSMQEKVLRYMRNRRIPLALQVEFVKVTGQQGMAQRWQDAFVLLLEQELPKYLKMDIFSNLWIDRLMTLGLLEEIMDWNPDFGKELSLLVQELAVGPYTVLYTSGEASTAAFHVLSGVLASQNANLMMDPDYVRGMWVGEKAIVNPDLRRNETIFSKEPCQLMMVPAAEFKKLVNVFGLTSRFEGLIQKKLWKGLCGRCGILGDHFAAECPRLNQASFTNNSPPFTSHFWSKPFGRNVSSSSSRGGDTWHEQLGLDKDFSRFIVENNMSHLCELFVKYNIHSLDDINRSAVEEMIQDEDIQISEDEAKILFEAGSKFRRKLMRSCTQLLANVGSSENHLIFISHSKVEAGTEAALMQKDFEKMLKEDPANPTGDLEAPVFLDSEDLRDLGELQAHVERSHNLIILLTKKVLTRPWVLVEIVTAIRAGTKIVPVEIQRRDMSFDFPDEAYHERLLEGKELDAGSMALLKNENIDLATLDAALRQVFNRIALPFSPHKTANVRKAELEDILKQCRVRGSMVTGVGGVGVQSMTPGGLMNASPTIASTLNRSKSTLNRLGSFAV